MKYVFYCPVVKTEQLGMTNCSCYVCPEEKQKSINKYTHRGKCLIEVINASLNSGWSDETLRERGV